MRPLSLPWLLQMTLHIGDHRFLRSAGAWQSCDGAARLPLRPQSAPELSANHACTLRTARSHLGPEQVRVVGGFRLSPGLGGRPGSSRYGRHSG